MVNFDHYGEGAQPDFLMYCVLSRVAFTFYALLLIDLNGECPRTSV